VGARIEIEGTQMRAGSDDNGQYAIPNVPVELTVLSVHMWVMRPKFSIMLRSADLTTTADFTMSVGGVTIDTFVIEIKRRTLPTETSGKILTSENWENTGIRVSKNIAAKTSGVVQTKRTEHKYQGRKNR
jgi:hypothetical protein